MPRRWDREVWVRASVCPATGWEEWVQMVLVWQDSAPTVNHRSVTAWNHRAQRTELIWNPLQLAELPNGAITDYHYGRPR